MDPLDQALALNPEAALLTLFWASLRTAGALALLPALGGRLIPLQVRIGLAGAMAVLVTGGLHPPPPPPDILTLGWVAAMFGELAIGGVIALSLHAAFAAAGVAGEWVAQAMGLGFATMVDPTSGASNVLSGIMAMLMWAIFLGSGAHLVIFTLVSESYRAMPTAAALFTPARLAMVVGWGGYAIASGIIAALPVGTALLLVNIALGVAARSAPQLNLFSIGFPLMLMAGLASLTFMLPGLSESLTGVLVTMQERAAEVLLG